MSPLRETGTSDERLVRYLLGLLPPAETERLDEASIADDDTAARLRAVEYDLVDAYARGALPPAKRSAFASRYLASPRRRGQVTAAREFLRAVEGSGRGGADRVRPLAVR